MDDSGREFSLLFQCTSDPDYAEIQMNGVNGCGNSFAYPYYISFNLIVTFIYLNLFIAIILEGFGQSVENDKMKVSEATIDSFKTLWSEFDPDVSSLMLKNSGHWIHQHP